MKQSKHRLWFVLFILSFICISLFYGYHKIVFYPPQSIHAWRQSDCASLAMNYYQHGMKFFQPQIHNLIADNGTSGYIATSEIPIFYYAIAGLYKIFGPHDFLIRLFNILIFLTGIFYLFRLFLEVLKDHFWAGVLSLLIFTSPVLVYYANNYLTNIPAFSFSIIGCYYFFRFYREKENKYLYLSALLFLLAGSMKVTGLFSVMVIILLLLLDWLKPGLLNRLRQGIFDNPARQILPFLTLILIIAGWIFYAVLYNNQHITTYFSTRIFPIWDYDMEGIKHILQSAWKLWLPDYFNPATQIFLVVLSLSLIMNYRYIDKLVLIFIILLLPVLIIYVVLQFYVFADHDYYTINMFILPVFILIGSMQGWMKRFPKLTGSVPVKLAFLTFLAWNIYYTGQRLQLRYTGWRNEPAGMLVYQDIRDQLPEMGIAETDTVIAISGSSQHALYLLNMKGWTDYYGEAFRKGGHISLNRDSAGIQASINKGARYLFVRGYDQILSKPYLQPFTKDLTGQYGDLLVFDLLSKEVNFNLHARKIIQEIFCDAEQVSEDRLSFLTSVDSIQLEFGSGRSGETSWSGEYSAKLTAGQAFTMTLTIPEVRKGQSYYIGAWMQDPSDQCRIIASAEDPEQFYYSGSEIEVGDSAGWSKKTMNLFIPETLHNKALKIYMYYSGKDSAYCDDLHILQYDALPI